MKVGVAPVFQGVGHAHSDFEVYQQEIAIADLAEPLGFDSIWTTEHHFTPYEMIPSPVQSLTYMAGRTKRIKLGTMVIVLPWHDPLRVASEVALLENLSGGRMILGLGRGLAKIEFDGFRVPLEESRGRFTEYARHILSSLESGVFECDGDFVQVPERDLRPRPIGSFNGRTYIAGLSPETPEFAVELGAGLLQIPTLSWDEIVKNVRRYEEIWAEQRPAEPRPRPTVVVFPFVDRDPAFAEEIAMRYIPEYFDSALDHYDLRQAVFGDSYSHYQALGDAARDDPNSVVANFAKDMVWGTPQQAIDKLDYIRTLVDPCTIICHFSYVGLPHELAQRSMRLFAEEVLPVVHSWNVGSHAPPLDVSPAVRPATAVSH